MKPSQPRVYADFHNADAKGRLRLTCIGTTEDLARMNIPLRDGLSLTFYADDVNERGEEDELTVDGIIAYAPEERCWVATIDWGAIRHVSDKAKPSTNGVQTAKIGSLEHP